MDPLAQFQQQLSDLADLSDDDLQALEQQLVDAFDQADQAGDDQSSGSIADALDQVRGEIANRSNAPSPDPVSDPSAGAPAPPVAASAEVTPETPAAPASEDSPADQETPAVTASTVQVTEPEVPEDRQPVLAASTNTIVAGANIQGMTPGQEFSDLSQVSQAMARRIEQLNKVGGDGEQVLVASIRSDIPEDRFLKYGDPLGNAAKIAELTSVDAITAAGGCCAPLTTRYDLFQIGDTDRPVKASLAGFGADRGGIRYFEGPTLDAVGAAIGFWTCADDAAVSSTDSATWKVCARVACPPEQDALVQAVTMCLTFGVIQSRVFPELVTANNNLALVAQARLAESALLSQIKAGSNKVTGGVIPAGMSFLRGLLDTVDRAVGYYRDRHRLLPNTPLRAIFPVWMLGAINSDIEFQQPSTASMADNFGMSQDEVESFFADRHINVTWTLDSPTPGTNGGGFYAALATDGSGAIPAYPSTLEWSLQIEGSWLFLDGGQLDLGIIRDSQLVRSNDYQTFTESFESATRVGGESLWITSTLAPTGRAAGDALAQANLYV